MNKSRNIYMDEMENIVGKRFNKASVSAVKRHSHSMNSFEDLSDNRVVHKKYCRSEQKRDFMKDQY